MEAIKMLEALLDYACDCKLIEDCDRTFAANRLLDVLGLQPDETFDASERAFDKDDTPPLEEILSTLLDDAVARGICDPGIASRDLLDTRLMGCVTPRPSTVHREFWARYEQDPKAATDFFYRLAQDSDYIRTYRVARDRTWKTTTPYGELDITINLSKPEKDPRAIAAAASASKERYPRCVLCPQNEGYAGRLDHPARQTIRLIPLELAGEQWFLQYSPYVYFNEHCIVLSAEHRPMCIDRATFVRLLEYVELFPHYTVGSNADLPIVGGSILSHEHYQGGCYEFAMARAGMRETVAFEGYEDVTAGIVEWPMTVLRLRSTAPERLVGLADKVLDAWRGYSDEGVGVLAQTDGVPHNTITPIARRHGEAYELDLVLRNNRTSDEHPLGIFHPHAELHHIKRENIGLIEVMGLAVLPPRLLGEMELLVDTVMDGRDLASVPELEPHVPWAQDWLVRRWDSGTREELEAIVRDEIGRVFAKVLEHCAVFDATDTGRAALKRFLGRLGGLL